MEPKIITKHAPAERKSTDKIFAEYEMIRDFELISKLFKVIPNIVMILNKERQTVFCNTALLEQMHSDSINSVLGNRPGEIINCIHAFDEPGGCGTSNFCRVCGAVNSILETQSTQKSSENECRVTINTPSGIKSLDLRITTNNLELNGESFTTLHMIDISEIKRKNLLERVFFHDLMNTAGLILNIAELSMECKDQNEVRDLLDKLLKSIHRLINEIKSQHELQLAENNELSIHFSMVSATDMLLSMKYQHENLNLTNGKKIVLEIPDEDFPIFTDGILLGRIISNLLKNALEASHEGDTIKLGFKTGDNILTFWVHNPAFIPEEIQLQIFQRSFSTKGPGRGTGTYSIRLFTEKYLKGRCYFRSSETEGTTFFVSLPINTKN